MIPPDGVHPVPRPCPAWPRAGENQGGSHFLIVRRSSSLSCPLFPLGVREWRVLARWPAPHFAPARPAASAIPARQWPATLLHPLFPPSSIPHSALLSFGEAALAYCILPPPCHLPRHTTRPPPLDCTHRPPRARAVGATSTSAAQPRLLCHTFPLRALASASHARIRCAVCLRLPVHSLTTATATAAPPHTPPTRLRLGSPPPSQLALCSIPAIA
ncbi:hypothetical protein BDY17DRAFT_200049 [Neohortaea acidophila]|uniref:Uncharacterized protein n=1 Tax=Neohortaea acidophila TaxID=245834 RepID=A0A6A6PL30_9PEZI|nr:uncharacterized protein BDY17DRAFT_200049 [Neohortaea acidophila]KAF2480770.1 hypothetical protein BDY17DRAFT_200049 [Neohortaea acidophila]